MYHFFKWEQDSGQVREQGTAILEALKDANRMQRSAKSSLPTFDALEICVSQLKKSYEPHMGGFGKAPKFPQPGTVNV